MLPPIRLLPLALLPLSLASSTPQADRLRHRDLEAKIVRRDATRVSERAAAAAAAAASPSPSSSTSSSGASTSGLDANAPAGGFQVVGDSGVSAQMAFLGTENTVFFLDKTENNAMTVTVNGATRPAWGASYDLASNQASPMAVTSNTFCAGGMSTATGDWVVFGGNQPVTYNGTAVNDKTWNPTGANPYGNTDGGQAVRQLTPCDNNQCAYKEGGSALTMAAKRWYPTIEALGDGSLVVLGGDHNGGYVSTFAQNEPSFEYWPKQPSGAINMPFLNVTVPVNLFPLTWLTKSGKLFMQAAYSTILYDMNTQTQTALPDMPYAQRVYPASAAAVMLPLTAANSYTPTILFCGGSSADLSKSTDAGAKFNVTAVAADDTCVRITPDAAKPVYTDDDPLPEARSMGSLVYLPDGKLWLGNGVGMGTAGYGDDGYSVGQSYGQAPVYMPVIYDPNAPSGSRFSRTGLSASPHERMYHSTAILLPDGAIMVAGSNPNKDVTTRQWGTSYVVEKWYPTWYSQARPVPSGFPSTLSYGGNAFDVSYTASPSSDPSNTKVVVIRTGFATHCMNFGQRYLELSTSYTKHADTGAVTMHVSQMPPNANIFQPGPAMIFLVVDGVPSIGQMVNIGSGSIGTQTLLAQTVLPQSQVIISGGAGAASNASASAVPAGGSNGNGTAAGQTASTNVKSAAGPRIGGAPVVALAGAAAVALAMAF